MRGYNLFNLKHKFMKAKYIIPAFFIVLLSFFECTTKENFDFKLKLAPQSANPATSQTDMNKAAEVINKRLIYGIR